jgi:uncharacterized membrane protein YeaQ/YmgE (transglycosylase-associated protein family)
MNPNSSQGAIGFIVLGFFGALAALLVAQVFPSIIPARAGGVNL